MSGLLSGETEHSDPSGPNALSGGLVREEQPSHPIPGTVESSEQDENRPCAEEEAIVTPVVSHAPDDSRDNGGESREVEQSEQPGCRTSREEIIGPSPQYAPCPAPAQLSNPEKTPITDYAQQVSQALEQALQGLSATVLTQGSEAATTWLTISRCPFPRRCFPLAPAAMHTSVGHEHVAIDPQMLSSSASRRFEKKPTYVDSYCARMKSLSLHVFVDAMKKQLLRIQRVLEGPGGNVKIRLNASG
jgi:hypothetical protein